MKILFFLLAISQVFTKHTFDHTSNDQKVGITKYEGNLNKTDTLFEVVKLDSVEKVYLIYAMRNNEVYKIASKKDCSNNCRNILISRKYAFKLTSLLKGLPQTRDIDGVRYNNTIINLEGDKVIWDLFICEDINNLCFCPNGK